MQHALASFGGSFLRTGTASESSVVSSIDGAVNLSAERNIAERTSNAVQQVQLLVQQVLHQQKELTTEQQRQLQAQVVGLSELLRAQAAGLMQTQQQVGILQVELEPWIPVKPQLQVHFMRLRQTQASLAQLHQHLNGQLATLQQAQMQAQASALMQTQGHIGGLYKMLQSQTEKLEHTQAQVSELQQFAAQAQRQVQNVAASHEWRLRQTQAQVSDLQQQLSARSFSQGSAPGSVASSRGQSTMALAGAALMGTGGSACTGGGTPRKALEPDRSNVKARIAELEAELTQLVHLDPSSDEESV